MIHLKSVISLLFLLIFYPSVFGQRPAITNEQYKQDFLYFWTTIHEEYCYFNKTQTNWQQVKEMYTPLVDSVKDRNQFTGILEKAFNEIYDHHAVLNTNTDISQRLVPSGTDIWAEYINGKPVITEVRRGYGAEASGILAGMELIALNDIAVETAITALLPKAVKPLTTEAKSFALRSLMAGNHIVARKFTLKYLDAVNNFFPDNAGLQLEHIKYAAKIESKLINGTGYIKINDCLYDNEIIPLFDSIMQSFKNTRSIILDLRETPGGGNTQVAKAIMGWFINKEHFYQKHEYYAEEKSSGIKRSWVEIVASRKGKYYRRPLVILCNHWTGSIAEGIVIGFDGLKRPGTAIIGTEMAGLKGAVYTFEMPNTKIRFTFPVERLYHINGLSREAYRPPVFIDWRKGEQKKGSDVFMQKALQYLK